MKPQIVALLMLIFPFMLTAQDLAGDPPAVGPANLMELLWALPRVHTQSEDALMFSMIEYSFGCDRYPQTITGLWDRFVCHANHWARLRREESAEGAAISWRALREWKLVQDSFHDLNVLVKNE